MSLTNILQVAIGLMLVYYALGLIVNILTTIFKDMLDMRAEALEEVLKKFIETDGTDNQLFAKVKDHPWIQNLTPITDKFFQRRNRGAGNRKPSEIPNDTFSLVLLDVLASQGRPRLLREGIKQLEKIAPDEEIKEQLRNLQKAQDDALLEQLRSTVNSLPDGPVKKGLDDLLALLLGKPDDQLKIIRAGIEALPSGKTQDALLGVINFSGAKLDDFRKGLEARYDDMMKNFSLLYRKNVRRVVVVLSFAVTFIAGADSIQIVQDLWKQPAHQEAIVESLSPLMTEFGAQAFEWTTDETLTDEKRTERIEKGVDDVTSIINQLKSQEDVSVSITWKKSPWAKENWEGGALSALLKVIGLILTSLATSQGSSFWYDILKKINPRSTTDSSTTESTEPSAPQPD